jgi:hypothetical protein
MLRQCLEDAEWGGGIASAEFGTSWTDAADQCYSESLGLNAAYRPEPGTRAAFMRDIQDHIGCRMYRDFGTNKVEVRLIREDYDVDTLPRFTQRDFKIVEYHPAPPPGDLPARVTLMYTSRDVLPETSEGGPSICYEDASLIARQEGKVKETVLMRRMVCDDDLAEAMVNREGKALTNFGAVMTLEAKWIMIGLHPGDAFVISYDDPQLAITQMICRVERINYGNPDNEKLILDVSEQNWGNHFTIYGGPPDSQWQEPEAEWSAIDTSPSASVSTSPSASVSASASEGTPSASASEGTPSASVSNSKSASPSASPSSSASA